MDNWGILVLAQGCSPYIDRSFSRTVERIQMGLAYVTRCKCVGAGVVLSVESVRLYFLLSYQWSLSR